MKKTKNLKSSLPKGRVMYQYTKEGDWLHLEATNPYNSTATIYAVLPFSSHKKAQAFVRWHNLPEAQKVERLAMAIDPDAKNASKFWERRHAAGSTEPYYDFWREAQDKARAILALLEGKR